MKQLLTGALLAAALSAPALAQTPPALVTFYSAGCGICWKDLAVSEFAGSAVVPYGGPIYDGKAKLVKMIYPNRFVTLRMTPGPHSFAGDDVGILTLRPKRSKRPDLQMNLQPGQHYFVSLQTHNAGVTLYFRRLRTILAAKDCRDAFREGAQTQPLQPKRIGKDLLPAVQPSVYFPVCAVTVASGD